MKKITLLLVSLFSLVSFTNCGGSTPPPGPEPEPDPLAEPLSFTCLSEKATITFSAVDKCPSPNDPEPEPQPILLADLEYSLNSKDDWIEVPQISIFPNFPTIELKKDDTVYFRGDNHIGLFSLLNIVSKIEFDEEGYPVITQDGELKIKGNIMSLISKKDFSKLTQVPPSIVNVGCFAYLFGNNLNIVDAGELLLPAQVSSHCYERMFANCENLISPPKLDATELAPCCYYSMFSNCDSLKEAPYLPATTLVEECYSYMFLGCKKLMHIKVGFGTPGSSDWPNVGNTDFWLSGTPSTGTFEWRGSDSIASSRGSSTVPDGWEIKTIE